MSRVNIKSGPFRVGDRVRVPWRRPVAGEIIEDRGPIGRHGRHIYAIQIPMDPEEPMILELAGEDLEPIQSHDPEPDAIRAAEYLKNGGLISILRSNLGGGRNQPRAWLTTDGLGNIVHTFSAERGIKGGQTIPFHAIHGGDRIFLPMVEPVSAFLESFGLDRSQADKVIRAVGTAP